MSDYFQRISSGIGSGDQVKKCHPDKMADQDNGDHLEESRKLPGNRSLISQRAEGQSDKKRQNRDDDPGNNCQNNFLKFIQQG